MNSKFWIAGRYSLTAGMLVCLTISVFAQVTDAPRSTATRLLSELSDDPRTIVPLMDAMLMRNIAKRLEEHCRELERMAKNGSYRVVENEKRAEAYNYLGKLRARESVELLLDNIDFDCVTNLLPMYFRNKPAADALVEIGNPHVFDAIVKRVCADSRPSKAISPMYAETLRAIEPLDVLRARISVRLKELKNNSTDEKPLANEKSSPAGRLQAFMAENKLN